MKHALTLRAGPAARAHIDNHGLQPADVRVLAGAAGGPKWLALGQLDRFLFGDWLARREAPLPCIGSSIGSWRFAIAAQDDPARAFDNFEKTYLSTEYSANPGPDEISQKWAATIGDPLRDGGLSAVLNHAYLRLHIVTARCTGAGAASDPAKLRRGLAQLALSNTRGRRHLARHLERVVFGPADSQAPFLPFQDAFTSHHVELSENNLVPALLASSAVPLLMHGVVDPPGAPPGMYRDGGLVDYHLALDYQLDDGIVLMPHFSTRIVPGWLDKFLPWRSPSANQTRHLLLVAPSPELLARLPNGKIPDRKDFARYKGDLNAMYRDWKRAADECKAMADEFAELLDRQSLASRLEPFPG